MRICVFEDQGVSALEPLSWTRPAFDLRCGALTLLERQRLHFPTGDWGLWVRPHLEVFCRHAHPDLPVNDPRWLADGRGVLINARWLAPDTPEENLPETPAVGLVGDEIAYMVLPGIETVTPGAKRLEQDMNRWRKDLPARIAGGRMIGYPWDLVEANADALEMDYQRWARERAWTNGPPGVRLVGPPERLRLDPAARVEPLALIDTSEGPVLIDRDAEVHAFSRVQGPCYVGPGTRILGARVHGGSFGPQCRIGGEVEASIVHGHSNKAHDGFLGHSYLGEWVNLGAGTQTSDLRNDYGEVRIWVNARVRGTGLMKVGAFLGDHTKSSIGALLNTGTVVGPFAQLLASGSLLPRVLPAFSAYSHGQIEERTDVRPMFTTAATMMARRGREWTEDHADFFLDLYDRTAEERRRWVLATQQRRHRRVI
jgi:UDP-N-acetylglucosamine diphosphorylase/glucosamine-1-phosphate N-acetyltransferase